MSICSEYDRLVIVVESVLGNLAQLTTLHLELFRAGDFPAVNGSRGSWNSLWERKNAHLSPSAST